jgi:hypothetical protein
MSGVSARANSCSIWKSQPLADAAVVGTDSEVLGGYGKRAIKPKAPDPNP